MHLGTRYSKHFLNFIFHEVAINELNTLFAFILFLLFGKQKVYPNICFSSVCDETKDIYAKTDINKCKVLIK